MPEHNWSGWPGAWCLDCGCDDPREVAMANDDFDWDDKGWPIIKVTWEQMECKEPGSGRFDPYKKKEPNDGRTIAQWADHEPDQS